MTKRAVDAKRESKTVDFKRTFDPQSAADWCELVKDLVAMANSGGGAIIVGVEDNGTPATTGSAKAILSIDSAQITDKVAKYTGVQFDGFAVGEMERVGATVAILRVSASPRPIVFERPGTYATQDGKQKTAFGVGTIYVRHGAKSEPATSEDIARFVERAVQQVRREWLSGVRRVMTAPSGSTVSILPALQQAQNPEAMPIRITTDPEAAEYRLVSPDATHPWRQKELLAEVNAILSKEDRINQFDILVVRHLYHVDEEPRFTYKARFATTQYSPVFRDWLVARYKEDHGFFAKARQEYHRRQVSR